jgi:hypothetical protein
MAAKLFEQIMVEIVGNDPKGIRHIKESLDQLNVSISVRSLQKYMKGDSVPSYEIAKAILKASGNEYEEESLIEILRESKEVCKRRALERSKMMPKLDKHIVIDSDELRIGDTSGVYVIKYIDDRVNELYGSSNNNYKQYIRDLIIEDVKKGILKSQSPTT